MSNKQIACVVLSMVIGLMAYGTLTMKKKLAAASAERDQAANKASAAEDARKKAKLDYDKKDRETLGLRDYLAEWQPYLKQTRNDSAAEGMFDQKLNQGNLVIFRQGFEPLKLDPASTIPSGLRARLNFRERLPQAAHLARVTREHAADLQGLCLSDHQGDKGQRRQDGADCRGSPRGRFRQVEKYERVTEF